MTENKKSNEPRDYKERFEFVLTTGGNIICQRYFRINNFNPTSLKSYELTEALRSCVRTIDKDLRDKTQAYLEMYAPKTFDTADEMRAFVANPENADRFSYGEGLVVRGNALTDYVYAGDGVVKELGYKFDDGEITENSVQSNKTEYKFAFKIDGKEVSAIGWTGYYPKFICDKIDLSNKRGKYDGDDVDRLSFEQYLLYKMVEGKNDLIWGLIKNICYACSFLNSNDYTTTVEGIYEGWNRDNERSLWGVE
jgi:hypothetical protein